MLSTDGSGRGAALVAAVLKVQGGGRVQHARIIHIRQEGIVYQYRTGKFDEMIN